MPQLWFAAVFLLLASAASAQHHPGAHGTRQEDQRQAPPAVAPSRSDAAPYAGLDRRAIASLSEQQIGDLRAGRGMGLALPAELNGYPGPIHVIELAEALGLTEAQRARMQALSVAMTAEAVLLGEQLIRQEADLDAAFRSRTITPAALAEKTKAIASTNGALREAHLKAHLSTLEVLSPQQAARYAALRGYGKH